MSDTLRSAGEVALCFVLAYLLHSTLLYLGAELLGRVRSLAAHRETFWRIALVGGLFTATAQTLAPSPSPFAAVSLPRNLFASSLGSNAEHSALASPRSTLASGSPEATAAFATRGESSFRTTPEWQSAAPQTVVRPLPTPPNGPSVVLPPPSTFDLAALPEILGASVLVALAASVLFTGWFTFRSSRKVHGLLAVGTEVTNPATLAHLDELRARAGLRSRPSLRRCDHLEVPLVRGVLRPQICLPPRALEQLDTQALRGVLAHELAHVARGDLVWRSLRLWIRGVFFFQPLHRKEARTLELLAEEACDDWAVQHTADRLAMAACLAEVASWLRPPPLPVTVTAMASGRSPLGRRIERLLDDGHRPATPRRARIAGFGLALLFAPWCLTPRVVASPDPAAAKVERTAPATTSQQSATATATATDASPLHRALADVRAELQSLDHDLERVLSHAEASPLTREQEEVLANLAARRSAIAETARRLERWSADRDGSGADTDGISTSTRTNTPRSSR